jgi:PAS domain S-box-containing protein
MIRWNSLRNKILAWAFIPTAIILLAVALVAYYAYHRSTVELLIEQNRELARLSAGQVANEMTEYTGNLSILARTLSDFRNSPQGQRAALANAANRLVVFDGGVVLLDERGQVLAAQPERPEIVGQNWSDRSYFRRMAQSPRPILSEVVNDGPAGEPVIVVAVPVSGVQGEFLGVLAGMFRLGAPTVSPFYGSLVKLRIAPNATAYIVDQNGEVIFHSDSQRVGENFAARSAVQDVLQGQGGALRTQDSGGNEIVVSYAPVPGSLWGLVVEANWQTLLRASRNYGGFLLALLALGVVVPAIVVAFGVRRITQPINDLIGAAQEVASGNFGHTVVASTGDEVQDLVTQFNRMSVELKSSYNALRDRNEQLELILRSSNDGIWDWDLRTNQSFYSPRWKGILGYADDEVSNEFEAWRDLLHPDDVDSTLAALNAYVEGRDPVYSPEFRLRHRDGSYRWILARGVALRDAEGNPYRMVGSHTDITERKLAEAEIRRQNEFLAALHETALGIIGRLDITGLLEAIVERATRLVECFYGWIYLVDPDASEMEVKVGTGYFHRHVGVRIQPGEGLAGAIWQSGEPIALPDYWSWSGHSDRYAGAQIGPAFGVPLKSGAEVVGVIGLTRLLGARSFDQGEIDLLSRFAQLAAIALENARLHTSLQEELSDRVAAEKALEERLAFEQLITAISTEFINLAPQEVDSGIQRALQMIGEFVQVDRSYVCLFSEGATQIARTHGWHAAGVPAQECGTLGDSLVALPWSASKIQRLEVVNIGRAEDLPPEARSASESRFRAGVQSEVLVPMVYRGSAVGFVGFDSLRKEHVWTYDAIALLRIASDIFVNALEHQKAQGEIQTAYQGLERRVAERTQELATLNAVATTVSSSLDLEEILSGSLDRAMQVVGADAGAAYRLEEDDQTLAMVAHRGPAEPFAQYTSRMTLAEVLAGRSISTEEPLVWTLEEYPDGGTRAQTAQEGLHTTLGVPLEAKGRLVGGLVLSFRCPRVLTSEEESLLIAVGRQIGIAVENARLYMAEQERREEAERRRQVAEGLRETLDVLNSRQSLAETLEHIVAQACRLLGSDAAALMRLQEAKGPLVMQAAFGLDAAYVSGIRPPLGQGPAGIAIAERRAVSVTDLRPMAESIWREPDKYLPPEPERAIWRRFLNDYRAFLSVPLIIRDEAYGTIALYYRDPHEFSEEEVRLATAVANQAALAIESARLREQAQQAAATAERTRLARELHDSVTQSLYSVTLYAEAAARLLESGRQDPAVGYLREVRDTAQEALREMRLLIYELRPPALQEVGLAGALQARLQAVETRSGMHAELQVDGAVNGELIPIPIQAEIYFIVQEALNNVLKHAGAQNVWIRLGFNGQSVRAEVRDDGIGFVLADAGDSGGLGIQSMRERAERIGAGLSFRAEPGKGTTVALQFEPAGIVSGGNDHDLT